MSNTPYTQLIDLHKTKCPLNFVKAKLALEKLAVGQVLGIIVYKDAESALNIPNSFETEGQAVNRMAHPEAIDKEILLITKQQ